MGQLGFESERSLIAVVDFLTVVSQTGDEEDGDIKRDAERGGLADAVWDVQGGDKIFFTIRCLNGRLSVGGVAGLSSFYFCCRGYVPSFCDNFPNFTYT